MTSTEITPWHFDDRSSEKRIADMQRAQAHLKKKDQMRILHIDRGEARAFIVLALILGICVGALLVERGMRYGMIPVIDMVVS